MPRVGTKIAVSLAQVKPLKRATIARAGGRPSNRSRSDRGNRGYWMPAFAGMTCEKVKAAQSRKTDHPIRIEFFDQPYSPRAIPFLQALLALNRVFDITELLIINQPVNAITLRKSRHHAGEVFIYAPHEVIRYPYVRQCRRSCWQGCRVNSTCLRSCPTAVLNRGDSYQVHWHVIAHACGRSRNHSRNDRGNRGY
jgi:hypothetical protein